MWVACEIRAGTLTQKSIFGGPCEGWGRSSGLWDGTEQTLCPSSARGPLFCTGGSWADRGHSGSSSRLVWWVLLGLASYVSDGCIEPVQHHEMIGLTLCTKILASAQGDSTLTSDFQVICIPAGHGLAFHWLGNSRANHSDDKLLTSFDLKHPLCSYTCVFCFLLWGMQLHL